MEMGLIVQRALQNHIQSVHQQSNDDDDDGQQFNRINTQFNNDFVCLRLARSSLNRLCCDFEIVPQVVYASQLDFDSFLTWSLNISIQILIKWIADNTFYSSTNMKPHNDH